MLMYTHERTGARGEKNMEFNKGMTMLMMMLVRPEAHDRFASPSAFLSSSSSSNMRWSSASAEPERTQDTVSGSMKMRTSSDAVVVRD